MTRMPNESPSSASYPNDLNSYTDVRALSSVHEGAKCG